MQQVLQRERLARQLRLPLDAAQLDGASQVGELRVGPAAAAQRLQRPRVVGQEGGVDLGAAGQHLEGVADALALPPLR